MEKKKFNFKKFGLVLCVCFITLFAFIPFANFKNIPFVSASDEVVVDYSFVASDLYNIEVRQVGGYSNSLYTVLFSASCYTRNGDFYLSPNFKYTTSSGLNLTYYDCTYFKFFNGNYDITWQGSQQVPLGVNGYLGFYYSSSDISKGNTFLCDVSSDLNFNCNVYKISLFKSSVTKVHVNTNNEFDFLNIQYFDVNENSITFSFYVPKNYVFNSRVYYLSPDFSDNAIYNSGYTDGYNNGINDGNSSGYQDGYSAGSTAGYENGYNAGINDSNQYSFYNLFGAVLDAPVRVFSDLFNFNLLGINLLGLITGLFTLAMIILIIKLILGGK